MKTVVVLSPLRGEIEINIEYLKACFRDCYRRGEAPYAPHFGYRDGALDDSIESERNLGIATGIAIGSKLEGVACYTDLGISGGMETEIATYEKLGKQVEYRRLYPPMEDPT